MDKYEIIDKLARDGDIEKIVHKLSKDSKNPFDCLEDLIQDIYIILLEKEDKFIEELYERGELGFWILRIVRNQLLSKNSKYYYTYIKEESQSESITPEISDIL